MKLLHFADSHLGFRQFDRLSKSGINQRELDVAMTFSRAVGQMVAERPDVIVIGGDVFHANRPTNNAILFANECFRKLRAGLPNIPIIMVSGNHDAPRTADAGCILPLFEAHNIAVVQNHVEEFEFPELGLYLMAVPDVVGLVRPELKPSKFAKHRVLLMHGEIAGVMAIETPHDIPVDDLNTDTWSYIALGHYHVYREVAPHTYYSGSLDYTSSNVWGELQEEAERGVPGKGFIVHDLETDEHRFVPVSGVRPFAEIASIDCGSLTTAEINDQIRIAVETAAGGIEHRVVRIVLRDFPRYRMRELDAQALREYRQRALAFQLVARSPEDAGLQLDIRTADNRVTLDDTVAAFLNGYEISPDLERDPFVASGLEYLHLAGEKLALATATSEG